MVKIDLITGFLGSGKTTFLLKYGRYLLKQGLKIGILEYDYGAINVDMLLLNKLRCDRCELEMVAAACDEDCLKRRFRTKLISMAMSGYDRVIVEPSGVFDMDLFFDTLRDEPLESRYEIGSVITIVNANLRRDLSEEESFFLASQAAGAGCILFSRVQLSTPERIAQTREYVEEAARKIQCGPLKATFLAKNWDELQAEDFELAVHNLIKRLAAEHQRIIFNGNGYSEEWVEEAEKRGLPNIRSMVEAIPQYVTDSTIAVFEKFHVFTEAELSSRAEILYETYSKTINIEARSMIDIASKHIIPAVIRSVTKLAESVNAVKAVSEEIDVSVQTALLKEVSELLAETKEALQKLCDADEKASGMEAGETQANVYYKEVVPAMEALRKPVDRLEMIVDKELWPMPSYGDLIFEV